MRQESHEPATFPSHIGLLSRIVGTPAERLDIRGQQVACGSLGADHVLRTFVLTLLVVFSMGAVPGAQGRQDIRASRFAVPPIIDGGLDDPAWSSSPLNLGSWISYNPLRGDTGPERTEVRVGYDDRFIYIGFRCLSQRSRQDPHDVCQARQRLQ